MISTVDFSSIVVRSGQILCYRVWEPPGHTGSAAERESAECMAVHTAVRMGEPPDSHRWCTHCSALTGSWSR